MTCSNCNHKDDEHKPVYHYRKVILPVGVAETGIRMKACVMYFKVGVECGCGCTKWRGE